MEKELEAQAESIKKHFKPFERTDEPDLKGEEIKEILHDVLTELHYSESEKTIGITDESDGENPFQLPDLFMTIHR